MPPVVTLTAFYHRLQECIGICFSHSAELNKIIQQVGRARWSNTKRCWYIPLSKENHQQLIAALKDKARIEQSNLRQYLTDKKKNSTKQHLPRPANPLQVPATIDQKPIVYKQTRTGAANKHVLPAMKQELTLKAYSKSTIKTYLNEMAQLLQTIGNLPADELQPRHLKRYLVYCYEKLGLKENTLHSRINAFTPLD